MHPEADLIEKRVTAWLDGSGLYASVVERAWLQAINAAELMARVFTGGMTERVALSAEWLLWGLGAVDDTQLEIAGAETSAILLSWALHLLGGHPDIDQRHYAQIESVLGGGRPVDIGVVPELTLTGQIITETLRLYPPGWMFTRMTSADCSLGGYPIPAGRTVIYSPYLIHRRPDLFPESDRFDPDRWADAAPPRNISSHSGAARASASARVSRSRRRLSPWPA